jgi:hypothetical protein
MATFVFVHQFTEDSAKKVHNFHTDTLKVAFSNTTPNVSTMAVRADITEISAGNGYTAGGFDTQNAVSRTGNVTSITAVDVLVTASGGSIGPYRYVWLYNDTPTSPADPLIGYWDKGAPVTLANTETDLLDFGSSLFTMAPA